MNDDTVVAKNPDVVARELAESDGAVLLNLETGAYHGLNPTGLATWDSIDGVRTLTQLAEAVRARFPDAPDTLRTDVMRFVESALERDLVRAARTWVEVSGGA
jgi:hypothetical protein